MSSPRHSVLWRSSLKEATSRISSIGTKIWRRRSVKISFGVWLSKHSKAWNLCTKVKFCTGTLSQPTSSWPRTIAPSSWGIWMCRLSPTTVWLALKLALPITPAPKSGMRILTAPNAISGHWDACFMKWPHSGLHLCRLICAVSKELSSQASSRKFPLIIQPNCKPSSANAFELILRIVRQLRNCWKILISVWKLRRSSPIGVLSSY